MKSSVAWPFAHRVPPTGLQRGVAVLAVQALLVEAKAEAAHATRRDSAARKAVEPPRPERGHTRLVRPRDVVRCDGAVVRWEPCHARMPEGHHDLIHVGLRIDSRVVLVHIVLPADLSREPRPTKSTAVSVAALAGGGQLPFTALGARGLGHRVSCSAAQDQRQQNAV